MKYRLFNRTVFLNLRYRLLLSGLLGVMFMFQGCESIFKDVDPSADDSDLYPLQTGLFREYNVKEKKYSPVNSGLIDSTNYQMREIITGSYLNDENDSTYILKRYKRSSDTSAWTIDSVMTVRKTRTNLILNRGNKLYVPLIFPAGNGLTWDGNALNTMEAEMYQYLRVDKSFPVEGQEFTKTATVIQSDVNLPEVEKDYRAEIYARDVGLIYKESIILQYCVENECFGQHIIQQGRELKQVLINYGKE